MNLLKSKVAALMGDGMVNKKLLTEPLLAVQSMAECPLFRR